MNDQTQKTIGEIKKEIDRLGLSEKIRSDIMEMVENFGADYVYSQLGWITTRIGRGKK